MNLNMRSAYATSGTRINLKRCMKIKGEHKTSIFFSFKALWMFAVPTMIAAGKQPVEPAFTEQEHTLFT